VIGWIMVAGTIWLAGFISFAAWIRITSGVIDALSLVMAALWPYYVPKLIKDYYGMGPGKKLNLK
jgi:hypothetical protein